jgi:hypothetical protein
MKLLIILKVSNFGKAKNGFIGETCILIIGMQSTGENWQIAGWDMGSQKQTFPSKSTSTAAATTTATL